MSKGQDFQHSNVITVKPEAVKADYAQFAKRNLDKMSWLYPLVNNKIGELLRIQLRHEQLFFIKDGRVVDEIGYGEDGRRFHERDKGKVMYTPDDITKEGYWFIKPRYNAKAAYKALNQIKDGAYYSVFSNQCQDWAYRLSRKITEIEKKQDLEPSAQEKISVWLNREVTPTVPAAWYCGMIALTAGILGLSAPLMAGYLYLKFVALLLLAIGISDIIYAFLSRAWHTFLSTVFFGLLSIIGASALWLNDSFLLDRGTDLLAIVLSIIGLMRVAVALRSRPFKAWSGSLITGILLLASAWIAWGQKEADIAAWLLGLTLSISFISAGLSTIWLNWQLAEES